MLTIEGDLNPVTGEVSIASVEAYLPGRPPLSFLRRYSSKDLSAGPLGHGWKHNLGLALWEEGRSMVLGGGGAGNDRFSRDSETGLLTTASGAYSIQYSGPFTLVIGKNGSFWRFEPRPGSDRLRLHSREDIDGNRVELRYSGESLVTVRGSTGRQLDFSYDLAARLTSVRFVHPDLTKPVTLAEYRYDALGDLVEVIDRAGVPVRYEYDSHLLVAITNPKGGRTYFAYDSDGAGIARWRSDGGRYRYFRRDPVKKRVEMTNSRGDRWILTFDARGNVTRQIDPLRRVQENVYDPNGGLMLSDMEPGSVPCISVADESARTETIVCGGKETKITYNAFDKPVLVEAPGGVITSFRYDEKGHLVERTAPGGASVQFRYSEAGDLEALSDARGNQTRWDHSDLTVSSSDSLGPLGSSATDAFGNLAWLADAYGSQTRLSYGRAGRLEEALFPDGGRQRFEYDAAGGPVLTQFENGSTARFESDQFGRPTGYVDPNGGRYVLEWDSEDNHTRVTNPAGESLQFSYDPCDRVAKVVHYDGRTTLVQNDDRDRPIRYLNPASGVDAVRTYNDVGLIASRASTDGPSWEFAYGHNGELLNAACERGQWTQKWSKQGRWLGEDSPYRKLSVDRDSIGRRVHLRDNHGLEIVYVWDRRSRLTKMTVNRQWSWEFEYDLRDLVVRVLTPGNLDLRMSYDVMQRMTERTLRSPRGDVLASRRFEWTVNDDLVRVHDLRLGVRTMAVDLAGRLLAVRGSVNEAYEHDTNGNVRTTSAGETIATGPGNCLVSAGADRFYTNSEGHIERQSGPNGETRYGYDGEGFLQSVRLPSGTLVDNEYDFIARRTRKIVSGQETRFFWDGQFLQGEQRGREKPAYYITLPESPIPLGLLRDGAMHVLLFDQIGSVTDAFSEAGASAWAGDFTAFGHLRAESGLLFQPLRALGQYHDRETGLHYNWFRHYLPALGRYISADPVGYRYSQNPYWYSSNPHSWVDYDGLGSLSGGVLTLDWRCDWTKEQKKDFVNKIAAQNRHIKANGPAEVDAAQSYVRPCGTAADKWRDECEENASDAEKSRPVKSTGDPCKDNDADHRMELVLGGANECHNMTPCNASVNRSCGSQIGAVLRDPANAGASITKIQAAKQCTPPSGDTKPCTQGWSAGAKLA